MARAGRKRKDGKRTKSGRHISENSKLAQPPEHIAEKRRQFSFVSPTKGPDGRQGEIDQDVCDGIGMFCALGLLDNDAVDPVVLRDIAREWRNLHLKLVAPVAMKTGGYERASHSSAEKPLGLQRLNERDRERYVRLDDSIKGFERSVLLSLLVDPEVGSWPMGEEEAPWVRAHIAKGLLERGRIPAGVTRFPDCNDDAWLAAAIRGLFVLHDASLPGRYERRAA